MAGFENLSPADFTQLVESGELWTLLDVREAWEVDTASVAGSVNIPMGEVPVRRGEIDNQTPIAVLCHSGIRSARVAEYLVASGAARVANIEGGIDAWSMTVDASIPRY